MKTTKMIMFAACATIVLASCKKDETTPEPTPNGTQLNSFFNTNCVNAKQNFTVDASVGGTITGSKGTRVTIYPNSLFDQNNQLVNGTVSIELIEIYDKAGMIFMNKPTMGKLPNGDKSTLISGGEYYLKITQDGQELNSPWGVQVSLPVDNTGGANFDMALFDGEIEFDNFIWNQIEDTVQVMEDSVGGTWTTSYNILDGEWGWTNVDRFSSYAGPKTVIKAQLPEGYDNTNCEVYLSYDGEPGALASLDTYTDDGYFSEHYGLIPIGLEVHFIAVTMIDGQLHYAIHSATITDGYIQNIPVFTSISQSALATLINDLP